MNTYLDRTMWALVGAPGILTVTGLALDRIIPDSPIAGWVFLLGVASAVVVGVAYKTVIRASQGVKVLLVYSAVTGPLLVLLALHTYIPAIGLTMGKIWIGYGIAFAVAAVIAGMVYLTRRFHNS